MDFIETIKVEQALGKSIHIETFHLVKNNMNHLINLLFIDIYM